MKKIMNILWNSLKYIKLDMIGYFLCCHLNIFLSHRVLLFCSWGIVSLQMKWDSYLAWQYICKLFPCYRQLVSFWWPKKIKCNCSFHILLIKLWFIKEHCHLLYSPPTQKCPLCMTMGFKLQICTFLTPNMQICR